MSAIKKMCLALACAGGLSGGLVLCATQGASAMPIPTAPGLATLPDAGLVEIRYRRHWRRHHHRRWHRHRRHHRHWHHHRPLRFSLGQAPRAHAASPAARDPVRRSSTSGSLTPRLD